MARIRDSIRTTDAVAIILTLAIGAMIVFPLFKAECLDERASDVYEQMLMAAIAIIATIVGGYTQPGRRGESND